jgi:hypothetical protein
LEFGRGDLPCQCEAARRRPRSGQGSYTGLSWGEVGEVANKTQEGLEESVRGLCGNGSEWAGLTRRSSSIGKLDSNLSISSSSLYLKATPVVTYWQISPVVQSLSILRTSLGKSLPIVPDIGPPK